MSDVLYSIDCGRNGSHQVIHCDRIRRCPQQVLKGEQGKPDHPISDANSSMPDKDNSKESSKNVPANPASIQVALFCDPHAFPGNLN